MTRPAGYADERFVWPFVSGEVADGTVFNPTQGVDYFPFLGDSGLILDAVEQFLTGTRQAPDSDRVLATVLFTDIVDSTRHAARLGDSSWRSLLERHHALVRDHLARYRGDEVDTAGGRLPGYVRWSRSGRALCGCTG